MFGEFTYEDNKPKFVALIDWKYPGKKLSDQYPAVQAQIEFANGYRTGIPFFMVLTYLDENYPIKCYYVIPVNDKAKDLFAFWELPRLGSWMSLRRFSKFQHALRGKKWNAEETIQDDNAAAVGLPPGSKLKDLSAQVTEYPRPCIVLGN